MTAEVTIITTPDSKEKKLIEFEAKQELTLTSKQLLMLTLAI